MPDDQFGIKEIYPSKTGGEKWNRPSITFSGQTRFGAQTSSGFNKSKTEQTAKNQKQMAQTGYMQDEKDWRNIEMGGHFRHVSGSGDELTLYARGGTHTSSRYCPGFAYKVSFRYGSNQVRLAKECYHVSYDFTDWVSADLGGWDDGDEVGLKVMFYNVNQGGKIVVKCEAWCDKNKDNNWTKVWEHTDSGGLGDGCEDCGGASDQLGTWGGPLAVFRIDEGTVEAKNLTVREINPGGPVGNNDPVSGGGCTEAQIGTGGGQTVSGLRYQVTGRSSSDFEDWGRDSTNYRSGGSGPSRRWNLMQEGNQRYLNCIVVAKINIGNDIDSQDNAVIKFRGCTHNDSNGGWYSIGLRFNGEPEFGKEYPHPDTDHYDADGNTTSAGSIVGKNIAIQAIMFNDGSTPTMELWHDKTGQGTNWTLGGKKRDTGNMSPGPVLDEIGERGDDCQQIQIRIDEAPDAKLISATAYEMKSPATAATDTGSTPPPSDGGGGMSDNWDFENKGGPVLSPAKLVPIFWGDYWDDAEDPSMQDIANDISKLASSNYWNVMSQYNIQKPQVTGQGVRYGGNANQPSVITVQNIETLLKDSIKGLDVVAPQEDPNTVYIIFPNPNQTLTTTGSPRFASSTTATHAMTPVGGSDGQPQARAYWVIIPTKNFNREDISRRVSQHVTNTISNPLPSTPGWLAKDSSRCQSSEMTDVGGTCELGDYCSNVQGVANTVQVTGIWSNTDEKCVTDGIFSQPAPCTPGSGVNPPAPPPPEHVAASALVIYSVDGWGAGGISSFPGNALSPIPEPPEVEDGFVAANATVLYNNGSNFTTDPGGGTGNTDAGNVFPEEPPPIGELALFSRHRYNIAVYSTTHCLNP